MYGDQYRSPGRDDRQDGGAPQQAPWETGHAPAPAHEDVKVAGSPTPPPHGPSGQDTGAYDANAYRTEALNGPGPGAYDPAETPAEGNPVISWDMDAPYGEEPASGPATAAYGAGATDFEAMRRTPRTGDKKLIRFAAVAAAVAVVGGGGVAWAVTGGSSSKPQAPAAAQARQPAPAPLTDAQRKDAEDKRRTELKKRASRAARDEVVRPRLLARGTPPPTPTPKAAGTAGDPVPAGEAQRIARAMLPDFGWSPSSQFGCLVNLWNKESHWNTHAANPSGAYGIPQALPGSKMSSAGPDWQNNARTQIKWGLGYIKSRYSTPCGAWAHSQSTGWY